MAARAKVGYVPEHVLLYDAMSGVEHVSFFASLSGRRITQDEARQRLEDAGLHGGVVGRRVGTYSKGMRQKVALAIALAKPAPALLLDEPLSGLDPKSAIELSARLRALSQAGRAVLLTSHDLFRALETASHIGIMRAGRLQHVIAAARLDYADLERLYLESMGD